MESKGYAGKINTIEYANISQLWGNTCSVVGRTSWQVVAEPSIDRGLRVLAGTGYGYGVRDIAPDDVVLPSAPLVTSGTSRWDTVVARRDWRPRNAGDTSDRTTFELVTGGTQKAIATNVLPRSGVGVRADQPLALVQFVQGSTTPAAIIDLRTWSGDGGSLTAKDDLVRSFYNEPGTHIVIDPDNLGPVEWFCTGRNADGSPVWYGPRFVANGVDLYQLPRKVLVGSPPTTGTRFLKQAEYVEAVTAADGTITVQYPRAFPRGVVDVQPRLHVAVGVELGQALHLATWAGTSTSPYKPTLGGFTVQLFLLNGLPYPGAAIGIGYEALGW